MHWKNYIQYNLKRKLRRFFNIREDENFHWCDVKSRVLGGLHPALWNKFYKRDLISQNRLHFANCSLAEDNVFVFGATLKAKNIDYRDLYTTLYQMWSIPNAKLASFYRNLLISSKKGPLEVVSASLTNEILKRAQSDDKRYIKCNNTKYAFYYLVIADLTRNLSGIKCEMTKF